MRAQDGIFMRREPPVQIAARARRIRRASLRMAHAARLGHPGGDLSCADILATLFFHVLRVDPAAPRRPDRDRFILSKGHASGALYATLAEAGFLPASALDEYMRPLSPLNGHPDHTKVPGVEANTGPLGHGLPIAVGAALGARLQGASWRTYVLTGDGELQEGSNWEAAMAAAQFALDRLTLIVDRNGLQQGDRTERTVALEPLADRFRAFGWVVAEVDGHDPAALIDVLTRLPLEAGRPSCVIARTHKGRGVSFMEDRAEWHHRIPSEDELRQALAELGDGERADASGPAATEGGPGDRWDVRGARSVSRGAGAEPPEGANERERESPRARSGESGALARARAGGVGGAEPPEKSNDCRVAFADTLADLAAADPRIVAVVNDSVGSSNLQVFRERFPDRLINVGIAEQNMVGIGAGLANAGLVPFVCAASCFLTGRALEQIKVDVGYSRANVKLCGMASGLAYGELGPTHHSIEDLAWTRAIAGLTVIVPADSIETAAATRAAASLEGPVFLRLSRMPVPDVCRLVLSGVEGPEPVFRIGRAVTLRDGADLTIIAIGTMVCRALDAARALERDGLGTAVVNMSTVRPIDREAVVAAARRGPIVTVEEHTTCGGLGGAVAEIVVASHPTPMRLLGVPGVFAPTGSAPFLFDHFHLTPAGIRAAALEVWQEAQRAACATRARD